MTGTRADRAGAVRVLPPMLARDLIAGNVGSRDACAAAVADLAPSTADGVAVDLAITTLGLIRDGHPEPARLASDVVTVCSAAGGRWNR